MSKKILSQLSILISFAAIAIAYVWPVRFLPYHLDTARLIINGSYVLNLRNFEPLILAELGISHPPLFMIYLAGLWRIFGESTITSHLSMVPFLVILLYSSYWVFRKFISQELSLVAVFLLASLPVIVSQHQLISISLSMSALMMASLALWIYHKKYHALFALGVASLIGSQALLLLPVLITDWFFSKKNQRQVRIQSFVIPVGFLVVWYLYHGSITGWWIVSPEIGWQPIPGIAIIGNYIVFVLRQLFFGTAVNLLMSLPLLLILAWFAYSKSISKSGLRLLRLFLPALATTAVWFGVMGGYDHIKSLYFLPLLILASVYFFDKFVKEVLGSDDYEWISLITIAILIFVSLTQWNQDPARNHEMYFARDINLSYQTQINLGQQAAGFLLLNHPQAKVYGGVMEEYQLTQPHQGYVSQPLDFDYCDQFVFDPELEQLVVFHPYHYSQLECNQLIQNHVAVPIHQLRYKNRWMEIYAITADRNSPPEEEVSE